LSFVVLPFENLSSDPDQEYFADGITDDLTTDLSQISGSFVIARNTAFTYKGKPADVKQIGRELGVRYVIEGSVRRSGDQVQVNVQLIDTESGAHLWADRFETDRRNLSEAQSEITGRLAKTLNVELVVAAGRRIERERSANADAHDIYLRGLARFLRGPSSAETVQEAQRLYERALEMDPESIEARAGVAATLISKVTDGWSSSVQADEARAEQLLHEALDRDPNDAGARTGMGILRRVQNRLAEAQIELERAIALDPNNTWSFCHLGITLMQLGRPEAGIPYIEKSIRLSPHDSFIWVNYLWLVRCDLLLGHVDQAIDFLRKAYAANPRRGPDLWLAAALGLSGDLDDAKAVLAEWLKSNPKLGSLTRLVPRCPQTSILSIWRSARRR
jgi:TolB-like protein/Tfp pilus assembly protein PilF